MKATICDFCKEPIDEGTIYHAMKIDNLDPMDICDICYHSSIILSECRRVKKLKGKRPGKRGKKVVDLLGASVGPSGKFLPGVPVPDPILPEAPNMDGLKKSADGDWFERSKKRIARAGKHTEDAPEVKA